MLKSQHICICVMKIVLNLCCTQQKYKLKKNKFFLQKDSIICIISFRRHFFFQKSIIDINSFPDICLAETETHRPNWAFRKQISAK